MTPLENYFPPSTAYKPPEPPRRKRLPLKTKLALLGGAGLLLLGGAGLLSGRQQNSSGETPKPAAYQQPTPTIDMSYYGHQDPPAPVLTPTPLVIVWPTPTPRPTPPPLPAILFPTVEPTPTLVPTPTPTTQIPAPMPGLEKILTEQQIAGYVTGWQKRQLIKPELLARLDAVNRSLYHIFTGKTFESSKFVTKLLTHEEYKALEGKQGGTLPNSAGSIAVIRPGAPDQTIFIYVDLGTVSVKVDGPLMALRILARETGNAEAEQQHLNGPTDSQLGITPSYNSYNDFFKGIAEKYKLGDISDLNVEFIERESLQNIYLGAVFHKLEELGVTMGIPLSQKDINDTVDGIVTSQHFNPQASVVAWRRALKNSDTAAALQKNGRITSQQAINLFYEYAQKAQTREGLEQIVVEIVTTIRTARDYASQIKEAATLSRRPAGFMLYFP